MSELKPCPFCGSKAILYSELVKTGQYLPLPEGNYSVQCIECAAGTAIDWEAEQDAIKAWNRRKGKK
jgi:Lar family restriction alleviation protein